MIRVALAEALHDRRMSQRELARRIGRHPDVVNKFAREATSGVSYELLGCICNVLGCEPGEILRFEPASNQMSLFDERRTSPGTAAPLSGASTHSVSPRRV